MAGIYGNILPEGFDAACKAYQIAIAEEDRNGRVPIIALELLANLESRQAETLADQASELTADNPERTELFVRAKTLAEVAIERLDGLLKITKYVQTAASVDSPIKLSSNTERYALLGSAYKRLALILLKENPEDWASIHGFLKKSINAYERGEARELGTQLKAYPLINRLQLVAILRNLPNDQVSKNQDSEEDDYFDLLDQAHNTVRLQFAESNDFFDAVMSADIEIARLLLDQERPDLTLEEKLATEINQYIQLYKEATQDLPSTVRVFNSSIQQLKNLAQLLDLVSKQPLIDPKLAEQCRQKARILRGIAAGLETI